MAESESFLCSPCVTLEFVFEPEIFFKTVFLIFVRTNKKLDLIDNAQLRQI